MRFKALFLVLIVLGMSFLTLTMMAGEVRAAPHGPITIDGDPQLQAMAIMEGWTGSGSAGDPILIENYEIDALGASNGINIKNTTLHIVIKNCLVNNTGDGSYIDSGDGIYLGNVENARIEGCEIYDTFDGIGLTDCKNITIQNDQLHNNGGNGLYARDCEDITVLDTDSSNNTIEGIRFFSTDRCSVTNCDLNMNENGVSMASSSLVEVIGNRFTGCLNYGIYSQSSYFDVFADNKIKACDNGIWVWLSDNENVTGNNITYSNENAIVISDGSERCNVDSNEVGLNGNNGIYVSGCPSTNVTGNLVYGNSLHGIITLNSPQSLVRGNQILAVAGDGLRVTTSGDCTISNNTISDNNNGIYIFNSIGGTITGNQIGGNSLYGISLGTCVGVSVYDNTLSDNNGADVTYDPLHLQAKDTSIVDNHWNYSGTLDYHGNMWSDWRLPDADHDGIVDEPYILEGGAQDKAPLTNADSESPILHLLTPHDQEVLNTADVYVSWEGWDNGSGLVGYSLRLDSSSWLNVGMDTNHHWTPISEGTHVVQVNATDGVGLYTVISHTFKVDRSAPSVTIQSPVNNSATDQAIAVISWNGTDAYTSVLDYKVRLNDHPWTTTTQTTFTTPAMSQGWNQVWINATDTAGNWRIYYMNIFLDSIGPELIITYPISGSLLDTSSVTVVWTVNDEGVGLDHCDIMVDGGPWVNVSTATSYDIIGLTEGAHIVNVQAVDKLGNVTSDSISFAVDLFAPTVVIDSPGNNTNLIGGSVLLEWTGTDTGFGIDHFEVRLDSGAWNDRGSDVSWQITGLTSGQHTLSVMAVDHTGRNGTASVVVIVDVSGPSIDIIDPVENQIITVPGLNMTWTTDDLLSDLDRFEVQVDGGPWQDNGLEQWFVLELTDGGHSVSVRGYDKTGNIGQARVNFSVDLTGPKVVFVYPTEGSSINNDTVEIFYDVTDISGIRWLNYSLDGVTWVTVHYPSDHVSLQPADGPVHFILHATDLAGWETTASLNFTLDNEAPAVTSYSPNGTAVHTNDAISITYNEAIQSGTLVILVNGVERPYTVSGRTYNVTMTLTMGQTYVVSAQGGLDQAGNRIGNFSWSFSTASSGVVSGRVVDSDGDPVEGAYVRAGSYTAITNFQGEFVLNLPPGKYNLTITASGMDDKTTPIDVIGDVPLGDLTMGSSSDGIDWLLIGAVVGVLAVVAIAAFFIIRRRKG